MEVLLPFTSSTPKPPTALLIFKGCVTGLQKAWFSYVKHETRKQISSLLIMPVHGTAFLPSLTLSPAGSPTLTTICSYRGSFGSLGNVPFSHHLWNSDVRLSTTLLHILTCAAKSQLTVSFLPNSSPGIFPKSAFSGASWHCLCLTLKNHCQTQYSVVDRTTQGNSPFPAA